MKAKISLTLDEALLAFVDTQPGATRSQKIEDALHRYREAWDDLRLREELAKHDAEADDADESAAWRRVMQEAMWKKSDEATSGQFPSPRSRSRARR